MGKPQQTVFYSWQSDSPPKGNRYFIQTALERAVRKLAAKGNIAIEPVVDRDTRNVAGAPKIVETILTKIERAAVFVADISIVGKTAAKAKADKKALPNPNVLMELGYALKVLEDERLVLVANTAFGRIEDLPFDLLGRRTLSYALRENDLATGTESQMIRKRVRDQLQSDLESALEAIFLLPPRDLNQLPAPLLILQGAKSLRDKAANAIGPRGTRTTLVRLGERTRTVTRDGLTITSQLTNIDHHSRHGIDLLAKSAEEIRQQVGDGAKTAILLCYEMVNGGYSAAEQGESVAEVLNGMERAVERTLKYILKVKKPLSSHDIPKLAETAGGSLAAKLLVEAYEKAKPEGVWMVQQDSVPANSTVELQEGILFGRGYLAEEFANDPTTGNCVLNNCFVLVCEDRIYSYQQLLPILQHIVSAERPVLIVATDIEGDALKLLVQNSVKNVLSCVAVKAPTYQQSAKDWLRDIAAIVGAHVLGGLYGNSIENANMTDLGTAERVIVDRDETQIVPSRADTDRIAIRRAQIQKQMRQTSPHEQKQFHSRLASLLGNTAIVRVGGATQDELADNVYKITTAMHSVRWALGHGYVLGGGLPYYNARKLLDRELKLKSLNHAEKLGVQAVQRALREPTLALLKTGGQSVEELNAQAQNNPNVSFNLISKRYEDLSAVGVWDAAALATTAVRVAFSHAKMILETTSWDTIKPNVPFL